MATYTALETWRSTATASRDRYGIVVAMVSFSHPSLDRGQRLTIHAGRDTEGYQLILEFPGDRPRVHRFVNESDLYTGTVRVQTELMEDGWRLEASPRWPRDRTHSSLARHFPRSIPLQ